MSGNTSLKAPTSRLTDFKRSESIMMGRSPGPSRRGWKRAMQVAYLGSSSNFMLSTNSVNLRKASGWSEQSCSAEEIIFLLQTWKPLLSPCRYANSISSCYNRASGNTFPSAFPSEIGEIIHQFVKELTSNTDLQIQPS